MKMGAPRKPRFAGSKECEGNCGRTISANKRKCIGCWTIELAEIERAKAEAAAKEAPAA